MSDHPDLEAYLARLDRALSGVAIGERAGIVTEIRSHVLDAMKEDSSPAKVLDSLGEPEQVASRYLLERGLKPAKPSSRPIVKWLVIGFLGTLTITGIFAALLVWRFTPLIKVDEANRRFTLLGGLIDIDEKAGKLIVGSTRMHADSRSFKGSRPMRKGERISVPFTNGKIELSPALGQEFQWTCEAVFWGGKLGHSTIQETQGLVTLDLKDAPGFSCDLEIPEGIAVDLNGSNGKVALDRPAGEISVELDNGKVSIRPDSARAYRYDLKVVNGRVEEPAGAARGSEGTAIPIRVKLTNGVIASAG